MNHPAIAHCMRVRREPFESRWVAETMPLIPYPLPLLWCQRHRRPLRRPREQFEPAHPDFVHELITKQLGPVVLSQPPREQFADRKGINRRPWLGREAQQLMFERELAARNRHRGIHTGCVILERCSYLRRRPRPFALSSQSKSERQEPLIDRDGRLTKQLRKPPRCSTPIQLHLPEAV